MTETFRFAPPYELPTFPFTPPREIVEGPKRHRIVIVGGGLAGLTLACDLAERGIDAVLLDEDDTVGVRGASSRGICYAQKSLELFDRLGLCKRIVDKGVTWSVGRTWAADREVYRFNLKAASHSQQPPFVNLQQFYLEWFLVDRIVELGHVDLRWKNRFERIEVVGDVARITVSTPAGDYTIEADHLIDATGANSPIRGQLGLDPHPSRSTDRWCITDVRFDKPLPMERWTWVDAPFNDGRAVWQHLMADGVWRMDYQMDPQCDPEAISRPDVAGARLREQLGPGVDFEFVWIGPYQYRDHLLDRFREGPVFFVGDAAHVVSPFGARGGNSGIQDAGNLGWKLALVAHGLAGDALLDSYDEERRPAAAENLAVTSRTARFIAPRSAAEHRLRRAVVTLARRFEFARALVNTGRMSVANDYPPAPCLPDGARSVQNLAIRWSDGRSGALCELLRSGTYFVGVWFKPDRARFADAVARLAGEPIRLVAVGDMPVGPTIDDTSGLWRQALGGVAGALYLVRPDAYLAATVVDADAVSIERALGCALGGAPMADAIARPLRESQFA